MVLAHHVIFTAYGFWLPNDPRGSWSDFVASWELLLAGGKATKTDERRSVAWAAHDWEARRRAKTALKFRPVDFSGEQALAVSKGFKEASSEAGYSVFACSILPEHVHMVIGRHERSAGRMVGHFKSAATRCLVTRGLHPFQDEVKRDGRRPSSWAERCWKVFLDSGEDVGRAVRYVEENPVKEGKRAQRWSFVRDWRG